MRGSAIISTLAFPATFPPPQGGALARFSLFVFAPLDFFFLFFYALEALAVAAWSARSKWTA